MRTVMVTPRNKKDVSQNKKYSWIMKHRTLNTVGQLAKIPNKMLRAENLDGGIDICIDGREAIHVATVAGRLKNRMKPAVATRTTFGATEVLDWVSMSIQAHRQL